MDPQPPVGRGSVNATAPKLAHKLSTHQQSTTNTNISNALFQTQLESEPSAVEMTSAAESEKDNPKVRQLLKRHPTFSSIYYQKRYLRNKDANKKNGGQYWVSTDGNSSSLDNEDHPAKSTMSEEIASEASESNINNDTSEDERKFYEKVSQDRKLKKKRKTQQEKLRELYIIALRSDGEEADDEREK